MDNVANFLNPSGLKFLLEKAGKFKKTKTLTASYGKLYGTQNQNYSADQQMEKLVDETCGLEESKY